MLGLHEEVRDAGAEAGDVDAGASRRHIAAGDYDADMLVNGEDPCPMHPAVQVDLDGDGVGAECDPNDELGTAPHCIVLFDTFELGQIDPRWKSPHVWSPDCELDGYLCSPATPVSSFYYFDDDLEAISVSAEAKIKATAAVNDAFLIFSDAIPIEMKTVSGRGCGIIRNNTAGWATVVRDVVSSAALPGEQSHSDLMLLGTTFGLRWVPDAACSQTYPAPRTAVATTAAPAGSRIAMFTFGLEVRVRYVVAYGVGAVCE